MNRISTKTTAEAVLRELPSVLGAYVSEDMEGHPREIHLLVRDGPDAASLARDIRGLLEERLGIPIDQRVISIAQLSRDPESLADEAGSDGGAREREATGAEAGAHPGAATSGSAPGAGAGGSATEAGQAGHRGGEEASSTGSDTRPVFAGLESTTSAGHVRVAVRLEWGGQESEGRAESVDTQPGRARAAAGAALRSAVEAPWNAGLNLELDFASIVQALDGEYVLVSVLGMSDRLGRRPLPLVGAHPVESDVESAAALATLKAINRVLSLALKRPE